MIKHTPWESLKDYISPSFFKVVPITVLSKEAITLARNVKSNEIEDFKKNFIPFLDKLNVKIEKHSNKEKNEGDKNNLAQLILNLYFLQIINFNKILLDIRKETFFWDDQDQIWIWHPQSLFIEWDDDFGQSLKSIYEGYYLGDDAQFTSALSDLNLEPCKELFKEHFGFGNQTQVEFKQDNFFKTFHEIFVECKKNNISLHSNFISLGLFLALLYKSLEELDVKLNVRKTYLDMKKI